MSESPAQASVSSWVDNYVATYRYGSTWAAAIFPIFAPFAIYLVRESEVAIVVAIAAEVLMLLVFFEWKTYRIRISAGFISRGTFLHGKIFPLSDVDLVQHIFYSGRSSGEYLYIRHGDTILLKVYQELVGFDDLVGFLREYARHHHALFATRDDWGAWAQDGASHVSAPGGEP